MTSLPQGPEVPVENGGDEAPLRALELFAGSGAVHLALAQAGVRTVWANDFCASKRASYAANFPDVPLDPRSIAEVRGYELPEAKIMCSSSPCPDHSFNGEQKGFTGGTRGVLAFHALRLVAELAELGRAPKVVVFENVPGMLAVNDGRDLGLLTQSLVGLGYKVGALLLDALDFVPQSRLRLFVVAVRADLAPPRGLVARRPIARLHPERLVRAHAVLPPRLRSSWVWWNLPAPPPRTTVLADLLEGEHEGVRWVSERAHHKAAGLLLPDGRAALDEAREAGMPCGIALVKRRGGPGTGLTSRLEVRFHGRAHCLMKSEGHEAQRLIVPSDGPHGFRLRQFTPRERARLTGLPEDYALPRSAQAARELAGDAVVVPVYAWLARHLVAPLAALPVDPPRGLAAPALPAPHGRRSEQVVAPSRSRKGWTSPNAGRRGIKGKTQTITHYLLPDTAETLRVFAKERGVPATELLVRSLDRMLLAEGRPPLERYSAETTRRVTGAGKKRRAGAGGDKEGDISRRPGGGMRHRRTTRMGRAAGSARRRRQAWPVRRAEPRRLKDNAARA